MMNPPKKGGPQQPAPPGTPHKEPIEMSNEERQRYLNEQARKRKAAAETENAEPSEATAEPPPVPSETDAETETSDVKPEEEQK